MQNHYEMTHDSWCLGSGWQTQSLETQSVRYSGKYSHWKLMCHASVRYSSKHSHWKEDRADKKEDRVSHRKEDRADTLHYHCV